MTYQSCKNVIATCFVLTITASYNTIEYNKRTDIV